MSLRRRLLILRMVTITVVIVLLLSRITRLKGNITYADLGVNVFQVGPYMTREQSSQLPDLNEIYWPAPIVSSYPAGVPKNDTKSRYVPPPFDPAMSIGQLRLYRRLMRLFKDVMFQNGMGDRFMLTAGTLIGSFHHHDFIPWDDEVDFLVDVRVRDKVRTLLSALQPTYRIASTRDRDKFYARTSEIPTNDTNVELSLPTGRHRWNWPFLDLLYYEQNGSHISEIHPSYVKEMSWPKKVVFPLYFRPFGPAWFPAPKNPLVFLRMRYGDGTLCEVSGYSHVIENMLTKATTSCEELVTRYPFVVHKPCARMSSDYKRREMVLGEESLSVHSAYWNSTVIHRICLATAKDSSTAHLFTYV